MADSRHFENSKYLHNGLTDLREIVAILVKFAR